MSPRSTTIVAAALAAVAVGLIWWSTAGTGEQVATVFRATRSTERGKVLGENIEPVELATPDPARTASQFPDPKLIGFVKNTPLVRSVNAGDYIRFDDLESASRTQLFDGVPVGKRLIAIEVRNFQAVGFLVRPGDLVDVLISRQVAAQDNSDSVELLGRTILQAIRVRAVDGSFMSSDASLIGTKYTTVTLEVTPEQAETLVIYRTVATDGFTLTLRPPGDDSAQDIPTERITLD